MNDPIPMLLSDTAEEYEPASAATRDTSVVSARILTTSILAASAVAIGLMIIMAGNPLTLFAKATASSVGSSVPEDGAGQSMPINGSTAGGLYFLPALVEEEPTRGQIAAVFNTAYESRTEISQPPTEALLKQFQAWAAEEDARSSGEQERPGQESRAQAVQNARAEAVRPAQKSRQVQSEHRIRAKVRLRKDARPKHNVRPQAAPEQDEGLQVRPEQEGLAHDQSVQNIWAQWAERPFGWLNHN